MTGYHFRPARRDEADTVLALYRSVLGTPFCVWDEAYPGTGEIERDLAADDLFVLEADGEVVGAISIVPENELDALPCWHSARNAGEFARVVIRPDRQGQSLSRILVENVLAEMKRRGVAVVHLSVAVGNIPAQKTYRHFGFRSVGKAEMWERSFYLYEKPLSDDLPDPENL